MQWQLPRTQEDQEHMGRAAQVEEASLPQDGGMAHVEAGGSLDLESRCSRSVD